MMIILYRWDVSRCTNLMAIDLKNTYKAKSHTAEKYSVQILERKAMEVKEWMDANHLKMNDNKTEFNFCIQTNA